MIFVKLAEVSVLDGEDIAGFLGDHAGELPAIILRWLLL